ncbi:uncharacterized protein LDX57_008664 [Aspergillus melleus]|uniref:uncharacterized protein n=1 Tax=Aspergillus melleus TaxID=138277 RepID=UPI001E8D4AF6|nr:uncharacterized protein LDX57_008664 [Aspergillus melleus]KAH8431003.1 hypothetical protein LDX57_008664 [Aspergillus melleus]
MEHEFGRLLTDDEWNALASHTYVFAILPDSRVPIGELRSASQIGYTVRDEYLNWDGQKELRKAGKNDRFRWQGLEAVFVRPRGKNDEGHVVKKQRAPEIWVMSLLADRLRDGNLVNIEKPLLTRTEYRKLRNGTDADYDIVDIFEKNGQEPPIEMRGSSRNTSTGFERPMARMPKQISNTREATKGLSQSEVVTLLYIHEKQMKEMKEQVENMEKKMNGTKERV